MSIATQYSLRMWIEYGFKQVKYELGWHDYRLTNYRSIERWWELVFSAYLLVSLHTEQFKHHQDPKSMPADSTPQPLPFRQHLQWESGITWKSALNNLRLLLQPYWCWGMLEVWVQVFPTPGLKRVLYQLIECMDTFPLLPILEQTTAYVA